MNQLELRQNESRCTQEQPPKCTAKCPVHVAVKHMIQAIKNDDLNTALKIYQKSVPFPEIISRICDAPCLSACVRNDIDESVRINALEKYLMTHISTTASSKIILPPDKSKHIGIIGSGLSSLTVAKLLRMKGYMITIYDQAHELGGKLRDYDETILPISLIDNEIEKLRALRINFRSDTQIGGENQISYQDFRLKYDAVYIDIAPHLIKHCLGESAESFELDEVTNAIDTGVFVGGTLKEFFRNHQIPLNSSPIQAVSDGKIAVNSIDRYLQNVSLTANRTGEGSTETTLFTDIESEVVQNAITPENPELGYNKTEANLEADRCLLCECLECVKECVYMAHYKGYPKRYFREIYNNLSIVMGMHHSNTMINTCSLCGLCAEICPTNANMKEVIHEARIEMVNKQKMPPSAHDFALRDMAFSTSHQFKMYRPQNGFNKCNYLFFPGCQLSGSSPDLVEKSYTWLCETFDSGVGLMLDCCGAPAMWAGKIDLFKQQMQSIYNAWQSADEPIMVLACPSCYSLFKSEFPDMKLKMLYEIMAESPLPKSQIPAHKLSIHDSCNTRYEVDLQNAIRKLLINQGHSIEELKYSKALTKCCGFGGLMMFANKDVADAVISSRIQESQHAYVSYCAMCRDNFKTQEKKSYHILEFIFQDVATFEKAKPSPDFSERHENRRFLKQHMLQTYWHEDITATPSTLSLEIAPSVRQIMKERHILIEDIEQVLITSETTGERLWHKESGHYYAFSRPEAVTYWVVFDKHEDGTYVIHNAYSHRLTIVT